VCGSWSHGARVLARPAGLQAEGLHLFTGKAQQQRRPGQTTAFHIAMVALALQTSAFIEIVSIFHTASPSEVPLGHARQLCRAHRAVMSSSLQTELTRTSPLSGTRGFPLLYIAA